MSGSNEVVTDPRLEKRTRRRFSVVKRHPPLRVKATPTFTHPRGEVLGL